MDKEYPNFSRWISTDCKVWEKRNWGWKFIGITKSFCAIDAMELSSHDCDHPDDIFQECAQHDGKF